MRTLLITGASGYLGWHLSKIAQTDWQVHGTYLTQPLALPGVTAHPLDLTDHGALEALVQRLQPDAVIHLAAQSKPNRCEQDPETAYRINVTATRSLAGICARLHIPAVLTSTDLVFDGQAAPYQESDRPAPINCYGRQKAEAEQCFLKLHPAGTVCRMPLMFGGPTPQATSFIQDFLAILRRGEPLRLFTDEYRTPAYIEDAAWGLLLALEKGQGLLHLGGPERISRYGLGLQMADAFGLPRDLILPCRQADVPMMARRPPDVSLVSERALALGYAPRRVGDALRAIAQATTL